MKIFERGGLNKEFLSFKEDFIVNSYIFLIKFVAFRFNQIFI